MRFLLFPSFDSWIYILRNERKELFKARSIFKSIASASTFNKKNKMVVSLISNHARSVSLPSASNTIAEQFEENLCRLRSSKATSTSSSSVSRRLRGLVDLYDCADELLQLPAYQHTLMKDSHTEWVNATLVGSLRLLDVCSSAKDVLLQTQEHIQNIHSVFRRRCSGELSIENEIVQYLNTRKTVRKAVKKCLRDVQKVDKNDAANVLESMLKDVESVTTDIFKSLLIHIGGSTAISKKTSWSVVSKLIHQKVDTKQAPSTNEFEDLDAAFSSLIFVTSKRIRMASPLISKSSFHARSISLPSRPHPITDQVDEHLYRLRSSETASSSSSSLSHRLNGLTSLFNCLDELLELPSIQKVCQADNINVMLDGSLRLLDICGMARDALLQTREHIQNIQSVLRRRCSGEVSIDNEIAQYLKARKKIKKAIKNCVRNIKKVNKNDKTNTMMGKFEDVEVVTSETLRSLLIYIAGPKTQSKKTSWSLLTKLVHQTNKKEEAASTEFENLDIALSSLICQMKKIGINMMHAEKLSQITKLESEIQDVDEVLESLFRRLVNTRAALLNILSN